MLETLRDEFEKRSEEIDVLLAHVEGLLAELEGQLTSGENPLAYILMSSLCLIIYNQVESTAFSCVEAIYDGLEERRVGFNLLAGSFKKRILEDCRGGGRSGRSLLEAMAGRGIDEALAKASLKVDTVFSGNVDARKIREVMAEYNLILTTPTSGNAGAVLNNIKEARKSLAHGSSSFESYGRTLVASDLRSMVHESREYMTHVIDLTEHYLTNSKYLDQSGAA